MDADVNEEPSFSPATSLGYQVNLLARMMAARLAIRIRPHGVEPGQFAQLLALYEMDGQSISELAIAVSIEHSTMSRTLSRMERDGLVRTEADEDDRRSRRVFLTERARGLEPILKAEATAVNAECLAPVADAEHDAFMATLARIVEGMEPGAR